MAQVNPAVLPTAQENPAIPTHSTGEFASAFLQKAHNLGLLGGCTAAADHGWTLACQLHELILIVLEADLGGQGVSLAISLTPPPEYFHCHHIPQGSLHLPPGSPLR